MSVIHPTTAWQKNLIWLLFAILFFFSGQAFTIWLLEPENFVGGYDWLLVALFPLLLPAFFYINYKFGCTGGACTSRRSSGQEREERNLNGEVYRRPPGG